MFLEKAIYRYIRPSTTPDTEPLQGKKLALRVSELLVDAVITIIALAVAWDCNSQVTGIMKYICVLYAGLFPSVYLFFYLVYRIMMRNPCYEPLIEQSVVPMEMPPVAEMYVPEVPPPEMKVA